MEEQRGNSKSYWPLDEVLGKRMSHLLTLRIAVGNYLFIILTLVVIFVQHVLHIFLGVPYKLSLLVLFHKGLNLINSWFYLNSFLMKLLFNR
ncbi:protein of unknown function [Legionella fallonii LLAP-10]|uniref:Uncharacterized protein n=1 Tax=Legionella fallonii LLAP-10 TaxID=1212491 RepID=A0A098G4T1_9GAMM|nr:protein of unknown function [Legionella fallonii LLAP-10]